MKLLGLQTILLSLLIINSNAISLYEYFVPDGNIASGLVAEGDTFTLNGKDLNIYSGAMHYFRVHPFYWRDTLKKLRAAGLNAVETYTPWNLHNPEDGVFDFGNGNNQMSAFLDIRSFVQMAQEEDLFVIFRPGPYICSEWDFGGLPYWLLKDDTMHVRTSYSPYLEAVQKYFEVLSTHVKDLTFMKGGAIIAIQIENEYGYYGYDDAPRDKKYLEAIKGFYDLYGFDDTLYFTSDTQLNNFDWGSLPGVLQTGNFKVDVDKNLDALELVQPNRPMMVMEFWTGWYDHWLTDEHSTLDPEEFASNLEAIFLRNASVNFYMFIGGTNFGFMAGANSLTSYPAQYTPDITSYDYDALLSEAGDYAEKYTKAKDLIAIYNPLNGIIDNPSPPLERTKISFGNYSIEDVIGYYDLISQSNDTFLDINIPVSMEELGLGYGYIVYSTSMELEKGEYTLLIRGHIRDMAQVLFNGDVITTPYSTVESLNNFGFWNGRDKSVTLNQKSTGAAQIDIMVENLGRVNYGKPNFFKQKKGLWEGDIMLDNVKIETWDVTLMGFKKAYVKGLTNWSPYTESFATPSAYRVIVDIPNPADTFLDMRSWGKGIVLLNGFNLGRYWSEGPQHTLYIPAPLFQAGDNEFVIFEQYVSADTLNFIDHPVWSGTEE